MKPVRQIVMVAMAGGLFLYCQAAHAGVKEVIIESTPAGAQVDVNGSITCTTPCTLKV